MEHQSQKLCLYHLVKLLYNNGNYISHFPVHSSLMNMQKALRYLSSLHLPFICSKIRLVNDLLESIHFIASVEAMYLGVRAGIHPSIIDDIISNAAGSSRLLECFYCLCYI